MNKICTSIEQSSKLFEIGISIETADMCWELDKNCSIKAYNLVLLIRYSTKERKELFEKDKELIPCWSLAALLEIIRNNGRYELQMYEGGYYFEANGFMTESYFNTVDACYEMILKLKEKNLL